MRTRKNQIVNEAYSTHSGDTWRKEFDLILDMVEASSSILDLGCGDGTLDRELMVRKNCKVCGLDMSEVAVKYARRKGIDAKIGYLEEILEFDDNSFDYVILCDVLEHLFDSLFTLKEALRVSKRYVICAFPNFAYFRSRLELMLFGIFPKATFFGYSWYDSQHIRLFSYKDFLKALQRLNFNVSVADKKFISSKIVPKPFQKIAPNIFALVCVLKIDKRSFDYDKVASWKFDV